MIKSGTYQDLRNSIKANLTIKQKQDNITGTTRTLICKTKDCQVKGKLLLIGRSDQHCELWLNKHHHLPDCNNSIDPFSSQTFQEVLKIGGKPIKMIEKFNKIIEEKGEGTKINNSVEVRRKISQMKYTSKIKNENDLDMKNINDLKDWLNQHYQANANDESFLSLDWNEPFVANFRIYQDNFVAFCTTKNLVYNIVKQQSMDTAFICADGTYKLNNLGYPTLIVGTVDLQRRFHPGNLFLIVFLFSYIY